jgi:hypothetical protein
MAQLMQDDVVTVQRARGRLVEDVVSRLSSNPQPTRAATDRQRVQADWSASPGCDVVAKGSNNERDRDPDPLQPLSTAVAELAATHSDLSPSSSRQEPWN